MRVSICGDKLSLSFAPPPCTLSLPPWDFEEHSQTCDEYTIRADLSWWCFVLATVKLRAATLWLVCLCGAGVCRCVSGLVGLVQCSKSDKVVDSAVVVVRQLIQQNAVPASQLPDTLKVLVQLLVEDSGANVATLQAQKEADDEEVCLLSLFRLASPPILSSSAIAWIWYRQ